MDEFTVPEENPGDGPDDDDVERDSETQHPVPRVEGTARSGKSVFLGVVYASARMTREKFNRSNKALIHWREIREEMAEMAIGYEDEGWTTLVLHPGDVTTVVRGEDERTARFRLVVPESELDALSGMVDDGAVTYDEFEVFRAPADDLLLFVVVVKSEGSKAAVFFPVFYDPGVDREFVETVRETDAICSDVTDLGRSRQFSFSHDNPTLFLP